MTDKKDETGKGPAKPGDVPRRPYATINLQATEVGKDKGDASAARGSAKPATGASALPPPGGRKDDARRSGLAARLAAARTWSRRAAGSNTFLSHVAAGIVGAVLTLVAATLFGLVSRDGIGGRQIGPNVEQRLATLEQTLRQRTTTSSGDVTSKLAQTDTRLKGLEDQSRAIAALSDTQSKLAATIKSLETRSSSPEYINRLAKLETALAALSAGDKSGTPAAALADKLTELEKLVGDATEASKSGAARADRDVAAVKTETSRFGQRLDALKGDIDERLKGTAKAADVAAVASKLTAFEQDLKGFLKGEGERTSNAARVLLTLEIASLKRAMDRGDPYAAELDAVRKVAGTTLDLAALERYSREGAPTLPALAKDFRQRRQCGHADAEAEPADATVLDRLLSGARSIVRVRKAGHDRRRRQRRGHRRPHGGRAEGRAARRGAGQGKKLPPKAALAAEDWLKKVEARHAVDQARRRYRSRAQVIARSRIPQPATEPKTMIRSLPFCSSSWRWPPACTGLPTGRAPSSSNGRATSPRPACFAPSSSWPRADWARHCWRGRVLRQALVEPRDGRPLPQPPAAEARARCALERHHRHRRRRPRARRPLCRPGAQGAAATSRSRTCCARRRPSSPATAPPRGASSKPCWPRPIPSSSACAACSSKPSARASRKPRASSPSARCKLNPKLAWPVEALFDLQCRAERLAGRARYAGDRAAPTT